MQMNHSFSGNKYNETIYDHESNNDILLDSVDGNIVYETYIRNIKNCKLMMNGHVFSYDDLIRIINLQHSTSKSIDYCLTKLKIGDTIQRTHSLDYIIHIFKCSIFKFEYENNWIIDAIINCDRPIFIDYLKFVVNNDNTNLNFFILTETDIHYIFSGICILLQVVGKRNCVHCKY
jgi:hypothetical protein